MKKSGYSKKEEKSDKIDTLKKGIKANHSSIEIEGKRIKPKDCNGLKNAN